MFCAGPPLDLTFDTKANLTWVAKQVCVFPTIIGEWTLTGPSRHRGARPGFQRLRQPK